MAHAWYLERVLPNLYVLKNVNLDCLSTFCQLEVIPRSEGGPISRLVTESTKARLRRYSELMEIFRRENEAKKAAQSVRASGSGAWLAGDKFSLGYLAHLLTHYAYCVMLTIYQVK